MKWVICLVLAIQTLSAEDMTVDEILGRITQAKQELINENLASGLKEENLVFLTIWNFDETILHGDTTEGLVNGEGRVIFKGLAQMAIEAGLSKKYPPEGGFDRFWKDYQKMDQKDEVKAYAYPAQILAGVKPDDVLKLATNYFQKTLGSHFFQASFDLIQALHDAGIQTQVITASPQLFVQGAAPLLNIGRDEIHGMETFVKNGLLTDQMVNPLTTRQGKVEKIQQIVQGILATNASVKKVYVLAGFGNDNANDIVFLKWIAAQPNGSFSVVGFQPPSLPKNFATLLLNGEVKQPP